MNDNSQSRLTYVARIFIKPEEVPSLRALSAQWIRDTIHLMFFFDETITEEEREEATDIATEIIAQFSKGFLSERFVLLSSNAPLPNDPFLAYKRVDRST